MIFKSLDFHTRTKDWGEEPADLMRAFRLRINHIVDSFSMRIPKQVRIELFQKLNVTALARSEHGERFWAVEGIGVIELIVPDIASIYQASTAEAVNRVQNLLRKGIRIAALHDVLFAQHMEVWNDLLSTANEEFDFDLKI